MREIKEADWKVLRRLHPLALRFFERVLAEVERVINNKARSANKRYLDIYRILDRRDREVARLFNGLKRSQGLMTLAAGASVDIRSAGFAFDFGVLLNCRPSIP